MQLGDLHYATLSIFDFNCWEYIGIWFSINAMVSVLDFWSRDSPRPFSVDDMSLYVKVGVFCCKPYFVKDLRFGYMLLYLQYLW